MTTRKTQIEKTTQTDESPKKQCRSCKQNIPKNAEKCFMCGTRQSTPNCCAIPLVIFLVFIFLGLIGAALDGDNEYQSSAPEFHTEATEYDAFLMSKHFVEATLTAPSTAEFPSGLFNEGYTVSKDGDVYTVESYVDAQNGFGAMVRTFYTIKLRFLGGTPLDIADWEYVDMWTE